MKPNRITDHIDQIPLILVISFFFLHNIYIVILGIIISIYAINKNLILAQIKFINKIRIDREENRIDNKSIKANTLNKVKEESLEDDKYLLAEKIEELGFIPSIVKDNHNLAT